MAVNRTSPSGSKIIDIPANAPTIGAATDLATGGGATVAFTAPSTTVGGPIFDYIATSTPGSVTVTGTSSPLTFSGLTLGTSYTFTVAGRNPSGSQVSGPSNSITITEPPSSYESIASINITDNSTGTVTFSNIPQTYAHLQIRAFITSTSDNQYYGMRFNGVSSGNLYVDQGIGGRQTDTMESWSYPNENAMALIGRGNGTNSTFPGIAIVDIMDYINTAKFKTTRGMNTITRTTTGEIYMRSGVFMSANAISSITIYNASNGYFMTGNKIMLFGIKGS
jgi:hypothetical protein